MGTWGVGIYDNDLAEDVRQACKDIFAYYEVEEGNQKIFLHFRELLNQKPSDDDYASFWYALANWQWKHGLLTEDVKEKAIKLLSEYAGIDMWKEDGTNRDTERRKKVLESLLIQLQKNQPPLKKPKLHLAKPKHKSGDIILFKATDYRDEWNSEWKIENFRPAFIFKSPELSKTKSEEVSGYDAHGKYMAILCVGTVKEPHSEYLPEVFDEYSVYVWYNYLSDIRPSAECLSLCGFLPIIKWSTSGYGFLPKTDSIEWVYRFTVKLEKFKSDVYTTFENKINGKKREVTRFKQLFSYKGYSEDYYSGLFLTWMFYDAFQETNRAEMFGFRTDDLLNPKMKNPELLLPLEIDEKEKSRIQGL